MNISRETLEARNKALRKRIFDLERLNEKQFEELHKSQIRIQQLESELAYMRSKDSDYES